MNVEIFKLFHVNKVFVLIMFVCILFYKSLETSTTGKDIFYMIDNSFSENNVELKICISVSTAGAK